MGHLGRLLDFENSILNNYQLTNYLKNQELDDKLLIVGLIIGSKFNNWQTLEKTIVVLVLRFGDIIRFLVASLWVVAN